MGMTAEELANEIVKHCYHKTLHGKYSCVICTKKAIRVAIRAAQAEQRRKDAEVGKERAEHFKAKKQAYPQDEAWWRARAIEASDYADAILAQEE